MNDDEIRVLVRQAIQKHLGAGSSPAASPPSPPQISGAPGHPSFGRYALPRAEDDVMCLIESAVPCNHCGYCQCHGH